MNLATPETANYHRVHRVKQSALSRRDGARIVNSIRHSASRQGAILGCSIADERAAVQELLNRGLSCREGLIAISYDYDGAQVLALDTPRAAKRPGAAGSRTSSAAACPGLVERRIPLGDEGEFVQPPGSKDRILSIYTWGATGLVQRVAGQEDLCPENDCTYQYLNDATGNCVGVVCAGGGSVGGSCSSANLYAVLLARMDAWPWTRRVPRSGQEPQARGLRPPRRVQGGGNLISPVYLDGLPPPLPVDDVDCTASTADGCEPADGMPQAEALAGPYQPWTRRVPRSGQEPQARGLRPPRRVQGQYHGSDRYETDLIDMDKLLRPDGGQPAPGAGRSTGFVHVGVRYYEPATGRFLQHDPMFIDPSPFAWGQHNRWVYCANDPVNASDPSGMFWGGAFGVMLVGLGVAMIALAGLAVSTLFANPIGLLATAGAYLGVILAGLATILQGLAWFMEDLGYDCLAADLERLSGMALALASAFALGAIPYLSAASATITFISASAGLIAGYKIAHGL